MPQFTDPAMAIYTLVGPLCLSADPTFSQREAHFFFRVRPAHRGQRHRRQFRSTIAQVGDALSRTMSGPCTWRALSMVAVVLDRATAPGCVLAAVVNPARPRTPPAQSTS